MKVSEIGIWQVFGYLCLTWKIKNFVWLLFNGTTFFTHYYEFSFSNFFDFLFVRVCWSKRLGWYQSALWCESRCEPIWSNNPSTGQPTEFIPSFRRQNVPWQSGKYWDVYLFSIVCCWYYENVNIMFVNLSTTGLVFKF